MDLVGSGRNADVFAIGDGRVLRRYRDGGDVAAEVAVMAHVAGLGYPVPRVHHADRADLVMDRVDGPTMLDALAAETISVEHGARLLADLHEGLHALPPRLSRDPDESVLHLDLHPANVMLPPTGPVVIDWRNAEDGPAGLDVAQTAVILALTAVDPGHELAVGARAFLSAFLQHAGGVAPVMLAAAVARRRLDPALAEQVDRLAPAAELVAVRPGL